MQRRVSLLSENGGNLGGSFALMTPDAIDSARWPARLLLYWYDWRQVNLPTLLIVAKVMHCVHKLN